MSRLQISKFYKNSLLLAVSIFFSVLFFCEFLVHYIVLLQCNWPVLNNASTDKSIPIDDESQKPVYAMFLADTHLLGPRRGHWFDKLRREWQMYRTFQTAMTIHRPDVVFILGDIFDEGLWSTPNEFNTYMNRFKSIFSVPYTTKLYVVSGNHDIGFHYVITPYLFERFAHSMDAPSVKRVTIRDNHFVLINSMAMEGDGCFLCRPAELALRKMKRYLNCARNNKTKDGCHDSPFKKYSRPILLQHFPMFRKSDAVCNEPDEAPGSSKHEIFRGKWDCLSKESSEQLLDILNPRLIVDGHTHHGCKVYHRNEILEITLPSFSWRNKNNPSYLLGVFTPNNYSIEKCHMTMESTVITFYVVSFLVIILVLLKIHKRYFYLFR